MDISFRPQKAEKTFILHYHGVCKNTPFYVHRFHCRHLRTIDKDFTYGRYFDEDRSTHNFVLTYKNRYKSGLDQYIFNMNIDLGSELIIEAMRKPVGVRKIAIAEAIFKIDKCAHQCGSTIAQVIREAENYKIIFVTQKTLAKSNIGNMPKLEDDSLDLEYYWQVVLENCFRYCEHRKIPGLDPNTVTGIIIDPRPTL